MESMRYEMPALQYIGQKIRNLRTDQKLSQAQLADSLGISARYLGEVEAGKRNLSFGILYAIANRLAIPLPELLDFESRQGREETIMQIMHYLEEMPLGHLQFLQRALRQFMRY